MTDFTIRPLQADSDYAAALELQDLTWGRGFSERVPASLMKVAQKVGGLACGAFDPAGRLLGLVFGLTGYRGGEAVHWSDMLAVRPDARDRGIGEALKRHQREQLLKQGVTRAEWTFDPLESRNAYLNFARLGAVGRSYVRDFYGGSDSPLHAGLGTDRLIVSWELDDPRVADRLAGRCRAPRLEDVGDVPVIASVRSVDGMVDCAEARTDLEAGRLLLAIPADVQSIKGRDEALAARWRAVTRTALEAYLPRGWAVTEAVRAGDWTGLLLERA